MKRLVLLIDVGTQSTRVAVADSEGAFLHIGRRQNSLLLSEEGHAEQEPEEWWNNVVMLVQEALASGKVRANEIACVGVCAQMHAPVGLTEQRALVTDRVQLWCDKRVSVIIDEFAASERLVRQVRDCSGNSFTTAWMAPKINWLLRNERDSYARTRWYVSPKDFINCRLTGKVATDETEASGTHLWDWKSRGWSNTMASVYGIDAVKLPPVLKSFDILGELTPQASTSTGLQVGTPVIVGSGDFPAAMLGYAAPAQATAVDISGTSSLLAIGTLEPCASNSLMNLRHPIENWVTYTLLESGCYCFEWLSDYLSPLCGTRWNMDALVQLAAQSPTGSRGVLFIPHLLGGRHAGFTDRKGAFTGLQPNQDVNDMVRSVFEGVALGLFEAIRILNRSQLPISSILHVGGGARNDFWNQMKANVYGMKIQTFAEVEASLQGLFWLTNRAFRRRTDVSNAQAKDQISEDVLSRTIHSQDLSEYYFTVREILQ